MSEKILLDTDVLVDYLRGQNKAVIYLQSLRDPIFISTITVAELFAGAKNEEESTLEEFIELFTIAPLNTNTAVMGGLLKRNYNKSHGVGLADALIAATALLHDATMVTHNVKHYPMLKNVRKPYKK